MVLGALAPRYDWQLGFVVCRFCVPSGSSLSCHPVLGRNIWKAVKRFGGIQKLLELLGSIHTHRRGPWGTPTRGQRVLMQLPDLGAGTPWRIWEFTRWRQAQQPLSTIPPCIRQRPEPSVGLLMLPTEDFCPISALATAQGAGTTHARGCAHLSHPAPRFSRLLCSKCRIWAAAAT